MKTLVRIVGAGLAATTITAAVLLQACAGQPMASHPQRDRQLPTPSVRASGGWQPQGFGQPSGDLSASGIANFPTDWPSAAKPEAGEWGTGLYIVPEATPAPRIDLQQALQASQGGG